MEDQEWLAQKFEEQRRRLNALAHRMLGSVAEAEDAVQEAWLRLSRSDADTIENLDGWLTTVVGRVCLDVLRSREVRREDSLEAHAPDLILSIEDFVEPESEALMADSVGIALLLVLETLAPSERLAFVLHDMFAVPFGEIAPIVGCSPVAARQLASRARRRVRSAAPAREGDLRQHRNVVDAFLIAARNGDFDALIAVLDPDVVVRSDHGALRELRGARIVAEGAIGFSHLSQWVQPVLVNGVVGVVSWLSGGGVFSVMTYTVKGDRIAEIDVIRDPGRLRRLNFGRLRSG